MIESLNFYFTELNETDINQCIIDHFLKIFKIYTKIKMLMGPTKEVTFFNIEELAIALNIKYLSSKVFERKFQGIKRLIARMNLLKDSNPKKELALKNSRREWLLRQGVLDVLFDTGYHPEIATRSGDLLRFLSPALNSKILIKLIR